MACKKFLTLNNGLRMPPLGIGTWRAPDHEMEAALDEALKAGYRHIDAAPVYMNEKAIGRVLKKWLDSTNVKREDLFITTKLPPPGNRASCVEKCLRQSLDDLQLSYVDMYLIHTPFGVPETDGDFKRHANGDIVLDLDTNHIETWKKMEEMIKAGLTKSLGVSNFNKAQVQRLLDNSTIKPANVQVEVHVYFQQDDLIDFCKLNDIVVTAYAPLGSKGIEELNKMAGIDRHIPNILDNGEVIAIANRLAKTPAQILLKWILERGVAAIPKSTNPIRLRQNLDIFDFSLSDEDMAILKGLDKGIRVCDFGFFQGSTSRYADLEKPKKKKTLSATSSLVSIPNTIKLSMLNSGLLSFEKVKLEARDVRNENKSRNVKTIAILDPTTMMKKVESDMEFNPRY